MNRPSNAVRLREALSKQPMTREQLEAHLGLGRMSVELALRKLRKTHTVYTIQAGRQITYELAK